MTRVSWLSDRRSPRLPAVAVAYEGRSPMTVAGPRRIHTGFLRRHRLTPTVSHFCTRWRARIPEHLAYAASARLASASLPGRH